MTLIHTPTGKTVSLDQYLDMVAEVEAACVYGHLGCAAWQDGPCSDELLASEEAGEDRS